MANDLEPSSSPLMRPSIPVGFGRKARQLREQAMEEVENAKVARFRGGVIKALHEVRIDDVEDVAEQLKTKFGRNKLFDAKAEELYEDYFRDSRAHIDKYKREWS